MLVSFIIVLNAELHYTLAHAPCALQVDYSGFSTINAQRFGQKFVGRVANPQDLLLFSKAALRKEKAQGPGARL